MRFVCSYFNGKTPTLYTVIQGLEQEFLPSEDMDSTQIQQSEEYREILKYLDSKGRRHRNLRHYAPRTRIASIINNKALYLTDGSCWNDKTDRERFNPHNSSVKRYGICLSATTNESIAMWMLYGGMDGNGSMINFNGRVFEAAASADKYDCGYFSNGEFICTKIIEAADVVFNLIDVLYSNAKDDHDNREKMTVVRVGENRKVQISERTFQWIRPITKHEAWSYESEVRFIAQVDKSILGEKCPEISAIRIPLTFDEDFSEKIFDSPVSDGKGVYCASALRGTVDWDLCFGCPVRLVK